MDRDWVLRVLETISGFSCGEHGVTRLALSEEELKARGYVVGLMQDLGMSIRVDGIGNIIGRLEGTDSTAAPVIVGSHLDSVPEGGRYDGVLGVVGGLTAIRRIKNQGTTKHPLELIIFTAEESSRFGFGTMGSKAMAGAADIKAWSKARDSQGMSFMDALAAAGLETDKIETASRIGESIHAFVELHIEQGPILEDERLTIGVVEAVAAPTRLRIKVEGTPGHSGTTPMDSREDALVTAAQIVLAVREVALSRYREGTVGTVGNLKVHPGVMNVIPGIVEMWVDIRGVNHESVVETLQEVKDEISIIAEAEGTTVSIEVLTSDKPVRLHPAVINAVEAACKDLKVPYKRMNSGAGHDAMHMASIGPSGMIFIPCAKGISHNPEESAAPADIMTGIDVLTRTLRTLAE
jgi:beta-ureidopropionase / N-carbamoyl-L-amino-acid hydrolase